MKTFYCVMNRFEGHGVAHQARRQKIQVLDKENRPGNGEQIREAVAAAAICFFRVFSLQSGSCVPPLFLFVHGTLVLIRVV